MRLAQNEDREALVDFMLRHAPILMFPLYNLTKYGMNGGHPLSVKVWVNTQDKRVTDALTFSEEGMVFPCCPNADWTAAASVLRGREVKGFLGDGDQVTALRREMGMTQKAGLDEVEPSFLLNLMDLIVPDTDGLRLCPLEAAPKDLLITWRAAYAVETLNAHPDKAHVRAAADIEKYLESDSHRVLMRGDTPVAMTGFNATLPEIVQVGGVYTPPELRSNGYARKALALHLTEAAIDGVTQAVLSAAGPAAARAYDALGFVRTGSFAFVVFKDRRIANG